MTAANRFPHHRLDAYRLALDLAVLAKRLTERLPRGNRHLVDQLVRAATGTALLIAEGANRRTNLQKRQRFVEARGECGEADAAVEILDRLGLLPAEDARRFRRIADRVAAMLTGLINRLG